MTEAEYRIKYLKYKQKYTNALNNMQGGAIVLGEALENQPEIVLVVGRPTFEFLKEAYSITDSGFIQTNFKKDVIKAAIAMVDKNAILIIPKKNFLETQTQFSTTLFGNRASLGENKLYFKDGIQQVDGKSAPYGNLNFLQFGIDKESNIYEYNGAAAESQLKDPKTLDYFKTKCKITNPCFLILRNGQLFFCTLPSI
jgi:hypothetical protein